VFAVSPGCRRPAPSASPQTGPRAPSPHAAQAKEQLATTGEAASTALQVCETPESRLRPFVVTWDTTEQAEFAAHGQRSLIVVKLDACKIELLAGCQIPGEYRLRITPEGFQSLDVRSKTELGAKLPFALVELGGKLEKSGGLSLRYFVRGVSFASAPSLYRSNLAAGCEGATHFVSNYAAGAYEIAESAAAGGSASASVMGVGAEGSHAQSSSALLRGGNLAECKAGGQGCLAPVRLRLLPVIEGQPPSEIAAVHQEALTPPAPATSKRPDLGPEDLRKVIETLKPAILACRLEHGITEPRTKFTAQFQVGADGIVTHVWLDKGGTPFGKCVEDAVFTARFPRSKETRNVQFSFSV
jgi:hypothetical protein